MGSHNELGQVSMSQGRHDLYRQVNMGVRGGGHTGVTVEHNMVTGSWDMAIQSYS